MKIELQKRGPGETDHELIWGVLFIPLFAAVVLLALKLGATRGLFCVFHRATSFPCPACGSFRAAQLLLAGRWGEALILQPLAVLFTTACALYAAYAWSVVLLGLPRVRVTNLSRRERLLWIGALVALVLVNWIYVALQPAI